METKGKDKDSSTGDMYIAGIAELKETPETVNEFKPGTVTKKKINDKGVAVIEIILILVVLVGLVVIFRKQLSDIISTIFTSISDTTKSLSSTDLNSTNAAP
jgi:Flp pilus assembly pilin Flp